MSKLKFQMSNQISSSLRSSDSDESSDSEELSEPNGQNPKNPPPLASRRGTPFFKGGPSNVNQSFNNKDFEKRGDIESSGELDGKSPFGKGGADCVLRSSSWRAKEERSEVGDFLSSPPLESMRAGFGAGLVKAAEANKQVVALCADLTESTGLLPFKQKFPERFIEVGVAEQNLVTVASGLAAMGKIPFAASYAVFNPGRNWEQIRTTICYNNVPVKIIGSHYGLNVGADGGSHQALEDIALMRTLPRMVVISPCDAIEARKAAMAMAKTNDPTYIRLAREKSPAMTDEETPFEIGKAQVVYRTTKIPHPSVAMLLQGTPFFKGGPPFGISPLKKGVTRSEARVGGFLNRKISNAVGIIATGSILYQALLAAKKLEQDGLNVTVMNLSTIKPLDEEAVIGLAHETRALVTVEEHQIAGGMGSAVAECLARHFPTPMEFVGVKDQFGQSGGADELIELYGLGEKDICKAAKKVLLRKIE